MNERVYRSKREKVSFLINLSELMVIAVLIFLLLVSFIISLSAGGKWLSLAELSSVAAGLANAEMNLVVFELRLPRIIVAMLAGASLSVAGSILQGIIRNPLASPDIIGISGGGSLAAIAYITLLSGKASIHFLPIAAFCGAGLISLLIYMLAWKKGISPVRLILIGIGISAITGALTMLMITLSPNASASQAYIWMTGSIYGSSWVNVLSLLPWSLVFIPLAFMYSRHLRLQELGDDVAAALGSSVQQQRAVLLVISVALAGSSVAVAGAVGFVGLIGPHLARKLTGASGGSLIVSSALTGSLIVLLADTLARTVFLPKDIPVGVFTAAVGAPFFIYLLFRNRNN
ncbi:iron ABC transporter permease [Robertmurraya sp. DFI.2.37]|uniref:FecCD family ABC transporter permease n=1 Tax=Robertmurraya sp. DFI.2.37 TaxID=3031819 RepID=UPI001248B7D9|nr:iron ABC transporter permease [Robertmurraya sp. DFI.2.37]MDF1508817.1 iron ABC transporter permease [Robertmurraya sp. DFI.2.37]